MTPTSYLCPLPGGGETSELALTFDRGRKRRVLIAPALFDEANRMRRLTLEVMRRLDKSGIDTYLPDLPGCNESTQDLARVEPEDWRMALKAAARQFGATHMLALRGGGLIAPEKLPGWLYAPVKGSSLLKTMLRARVIALREAGREETTEGLLVAGLQIGIDLAGWSLSGEMLRQLQDALPVMRGNLALIDQETVGGGALWLRAEPGEDPAQADAIAAIVAVGVAA